MKPTNIDNKSVSRS